MCISMIPKVIYSKNHHGRYRFNGYRLGLLVALCRGAKCACVEMLCDVGLVSIEYLFSY